MDKRQPKSFAKAGAFAVAGAVALISAATTARPQAVDTEPAYADYGRALAHYATVARPNGVVRRLLVDRSALPALRDGVLTDRTMIVMEVFEGGPRPARIEMKRWREAEWLYGVHGPDVRDWTTGPDRECATCHAKAGDRFEIFTFASLVNFARTGTIDRFACSAAGRDPCTEEIYRRPVSDRR
jgi:hypothetical protein